MNFDDFRPGALLGRIELDLEPDAVANWRKLFPGGAEGEDTRLIPAGFIAVIAMRAYTNACPVRPPGNIHGEQSYDVISLPEIGSRVVTEVICAEKQIKGARRWITFETRTRDERSDEPLFNGVMKIAWSR